MILRMSPLQTSRSVTTTYGLIMLFLIFICLTSEQAAVVEASITIVDSGKVYSSKMDKIHGIKLRDGFQYPAHLQQIRGNEHLCYDSTANYIQNWNITIPSDGSPGT